MPLEGGLYVWAHRAFGDLGAFLTAWNILIYAIAVTAAILYAVPTEIAYLIGPSAAWLPENRLAALQNVLVGLPKPSRCLQAGKRPCAGPQIATDQAHSPSGPYKTHPSD